MKSIENNSEHRVRKVVNRLFAHASMLLSIIVLVCFVLDKFNEYHSSFIPLSPSIVRSIAFARDMRDFTVPSATFNSAAMS